MASCGGRIHGSRHPHTELRCEQERNGAALETAAPDLTAQASPGPSNHRPPQTARTGILPLAVPGPAPGMRTASATHEPLCHGKGNVVLFLSWDGWNQAVYHVYTAHLASCCKPRNQL